MEGTHLRALTLRENPPPSELAALSSRMLGVPSAHACCVYPTHARFAPFTQACCVLSVYATLPPRMRRRAGSTYTEHIQHHNKQTIIVIHRLCTSSNACVRNTSTRSTFIITIKHIHNINTRISICI